MTSILDLDKVIWINILDFVVGDISRYPVSYTYTFSLKDAPDNVRKVLVGGGVSGDSDDDSDNDDSDNSDDENEVASAAMFMAAKTLAKVKERKLQGSDDANNTTAYKTYFNNGEKYHDIYLLRNVCKVIKAHIDYYNKLHGRYFRYCSYPATPLSPIAYSNSRRPFYYNCREKRMFTNFYCKGRRTRILPEDAEWNNRKSKYVIRKMWKEYKRNNNPWFSKNYVFDEERWWYNVFRANLTKKEFDYFSLREK